MEKLIELLNEYGNEICNHWGDYQTDMDFTDRDTYWYLSKKFWFIKWLVENDKIDLDMPMETLSFREYYDIKKSDFLIALLSISDTPIEDLINYLK